MMASIDFALLMITGATVVGYLVSSAVTLTLRGKRACGYQVLDEAIRIVESFEARAAK
jgi:hypothetical protein